ncbi:MAG: DUF2202 domain-containing protein [Pseudomonadota bacterium]
MDQVVKALGVALADERHALATYNAVLVRFGDVRPFVNIADAEQRHIDALLRLYQRYDVPVPDDQTIIADETHTMDLASLCQSGMDGEIENFRLYDEELLPAVSDYPDITSVLRALRDASANNHLPAFRRCVVRGDCGGQSAGLGGRRRRRHRGGQG